MPAKKASVAAPKPTYAVMVAESLKALNDRTGSSVQAISKHVQAQYHIDINKPALVKAIKKGVESGDLVQIKASYKLNKLKKAPAAPKPKKAAAPAKKKVLLKAAPKRATPSTMTATKTATKKAATKPKRTIAKKTSKRSSTTSTKKAVTKRVAPKKTSTKKKATAKK